MADENSTTSPLDQQQDQQPNRPPVQRSEQMPPAVPPPPTQQMQVVNPYAAPGTPTVSEKPKPKNSVWVPVMSAAVVAALLASASTAGLMIVMDREDGSQSLADVGQSSTENAPVKSSSAENPDWTAVTSAVQESVVSIQVESQAGGAEGSGVVLDSQGHVLTNNHVVANANKVQVTLSDGRVYKADIVGTDPTTDLAVALLSDPPSDLQAAAFADSSLVVVGEPVMALGNPLGLANTATTGIVSAVDRPVTAGGAGGTGQVVTNALQIDAAVNPGNSGGPLFNASGEVIGITSSIATLSSGLSSGESGSIGLGFAIPSNLATRMSEQLKENGTAKHAFLGVVLSNSIATADEVTRRGAGVEDVVPGSPASEAGIRTDDVIVAIDGEPVNGAASLTGFVREKRAGEESVLTVVRGGETHEIAATFAVREESVTSEPDSQGGAPERPGRDRDSGADQSQPGNLPDWLRGFFD